MDLPTHLALGRMFSGIYTDEDITLTPDMARGIVSELAKAGGQQLSTRHGHIAGRDGNIDKCHACGQDIRSDVHIWTRSSAG